MILKNNYLLVFLSALLMGLSQQPLHLGFLSWFAIIPFISVLTKQNSYKEMLLFSFVWGIIYHLTVVFWLSTNIGTTKFIAFLSMIGAVLVLSLNTVIIVLVWYRSTKGIKEIYRLILFALIWVSVEYIRSYGLLGFPWVSIANSQIDFLLLVQNAEITGIYGITFWVLLVNLLLYNLILKKSKKSFAILAFIFILPWLTGYGLYSKYGNSSYENNEGLPILIIQPNINLIDKRDHITKQQTLNKIVSQTHNNLSPNIKLILWPESAIPYHKLQNQKDRNILSKKLFDNEDQYLLTGNIFYEKSRAHNSSILLKNNEITNFYHKRQLVPIAEYVPFSGNFPSLGNINIGQTNFSKGENDVIFHIDNYRFISLICFESTFPEINRRNANQGIDAIIYLVNDGWYTSPPEPQQHAKQSIYRAIENRLPVIRCANTGISMVINPRGEIIEDIGLNKAGTITTRIHRNSNEKTFYTKFGNVFALILLLISTLFFIKSFFTFEKK